MKKTERVFTRISNFKHHLSLMRARGDKVLFHYFDRAGNVHTLSYGGFAERVLAFLAGLDKENLVGKKIAVIGETSPAWYTAFFAAIIGGGVAVPLDKELATSEIENFLVRADADIIVFSRLFESKFCEMAARHPEIVFLPMEAPAVDAPYHAPMDEVIAAGADLAFEPASPTELDRVAVLLFTSGTTGTAKCVMLSERNLCSAINAACDAVYFCADDRLLSVLPVHHTYELTCSLAGMNYGMEIAINDSLRHVMRNIQRFRPTALVLVPLFLTTMEKKIWDEIRKRGKVGFVKAMLAASDGMRHVGLDARALLFRDIRAAFGGNLQKIIVGGAPLDRHTAATFRSLGINVWEGYGITECSPLIAVDVYYKSKPGSVGPAVCCCTVRIDEPIPDERGHAVGEICVQGKNVMLGYYKDEEATKAAFTDDGWFRTGDLGYMDRDGYIYITGRKKSVIILENGKNVFPEEIEEYLYTLDFVEECVVVGRPSGEDGALRLTALIYPRRDAFDKSATDDEIFEKIKTEVDRLNRRLPVYKQIRRIELRDTPFEKTTSRKIKR
ncbi:MAG: AMP-binding protein, partial [Clostridia bacterium]|nr:AMP-binding protein [Clostridia bacterium]